MDSRLNAAKLPELLRRQRRFTTMLMATILAGMLTTCGWSADLNTPRLCVEQCEEIVKLRRVLAFARCHQTSDFIEKSESLSDEQIAALGSAA